MTGLETLNHLLDTKTAYKISIQIYKQVRDYESEEKKKKSISI